MAIKREKASDLGRRLLDLLDRYNSNPHNKKKLKTCRNIAEALYERGLVHVHSKEQDMEPPIDKDSAVSSIERKINRHINEGRLTDKSGEYLPAYCTLFDCSADYLLGRTDIQSANISVRQICDTLALTEAAVLSLGEMRFRFAPFRVKSDNSHNNTFNLASPILSHPQFKDIAWSFRELQSTWEEEPNGENLKKLTEEIGEARIAAAAKATDFIPEADDPEGLLPPPTDQEKEDYQRFTTAQDKDYTAYEEWKLRTRLCKYELCAKIMAILEEAFPTKY